MLNYNQDVSDIQTPAYNLQLTTPPIAPGEMGNNPFELVHPRQTTGNMLSSSIKTKRKVNSLDHLNIVWLYLFCLAKENIYGLQCRQIIILFTSLTGFLLMRWFSRGDNCGYLLHRWPKWHNLLLESDKI